jgi:gliding motility-associated-like protein
MKIKQFFLILSAFVFWMIPKYTSAQAPNLGTAADFVLFTSVGAVTNSGTPFLTLLTGNVGTNSAPTITGFGNVDGQMHYVGDPQSMQANTDLNAAYLQLNAAIPTFFIAPLMGNGQVLVPGVYDIAGPATLNLDLSFDAQGDPNAVFIVKIGGAFSSSTNSKVKLLNGAQSCNIFWKIEGLASLASGTFMRGTIVVNNAAIDFSAGDTLDGRALSTAGAITLNSLSGAIPSGCGSPVLNGPVAPNLASAACYALFSGIGPVTDNGQSFINGQGDVGNDAGGLTTGFDPLKLTGAIHSGDPSTAAAAADLTNAYNYMNLLPTDIQLLFPPLFGHNLILTPHTYLLSGAVTFTDTLYLNAEGNVNAVFVINIDGAFSTSTFSRVILINGAQARNVYWNIDGAVNIGDFSIFNGTIIAQGAVELQTGVVVNGRVLTGVGAVTTYSMTINTTPGCGSPPTNIFTEPVNQEVCLGDSAIFGVLASGTGLSYQWRKGNVDLVDGGNISGANTDTLIIFPVMYSDTASDYNLVISGMPNDTSINVSLTIIEAPSIDTVYISQQSCSGDTVIFTVVASGDGLSYQWRKGNLNLMNGANIAGADSSVMIISAASIADTASDYNVIVFGICGNDTSANLVLQFDTVNIITQPISQTLCLGDTATFTVGATGTGLIYQWRNGTLNLTNGGNISGADSSTLVISGVNLSDTSSFYNVIVTGSCLPADTSIMVSLNVSHVTVNVAGQVSCNGASDGSATANPVDAALPVTFIWSNGQTTATATALSAAIYSVSITDANGCTATASVIITEPTAITATITSQTNASCFGETGSATVTATGGTLGYSYIWSNGGLTDTAIGLAAGVHSVTVSDLNNCTATASVTITAPTAITATITSQTNASCFGETGSATVTATGGTLGYSYIWSNGGLTDTAIGLAAGVHSVTVSDLNNCTATASVTITAPTAITATITIQTNASCFGQTGSATVTATGGTLGYSYIWSNGGLTDTAIGLAAGVHSVTVSDLNNCTATALVTITAPAEIVLTAVVSSNYNGAQVSCNGASDASAIATATGGTALFSYLWSDGQTTATATGLAAGNYTVTATDSNNCTNSASVVIIEPDVLTVSAIVQEASCSLPNGGINVTVTGGTSPYDFIWSNLSTTEDLTGLPVGTYTVTVTDMNACTAVYTDSIVENISAIVITAEIQTSICYELNTGSIEIMPLIGSSPYSFEWSNGESTALVTDLAEAIYTVTITDASGCVLIDSFEIIVLEDALSLQLTSPLFTNGFNVSAYGAADASINAVVSGGQSNYSYAWSNTSTVQNLISIPAGIYTLTVTDANACTVSASITLTQPEFGLPEMPEGISPNNDGKNDAFVIHYIENYPENTLVIFNRWGEELLRYEGYLNQWTGLNKNGEELPEGTYYPILVYKLNGVDKILKGFVDIRR